MPTLEAGSVKAGDIGGYVKTARTFAHRSTVSGHVEVLRNVRVFENAQVSNDAKIYAGHVYGIARANGGATIWNGHLLGDGDLPVSPTA
jgi:hypothetical protein